MRALGWAWVLIGWCGICPAARGYNAATHRDLTAWAFELMAVAGEGRVAAALAHDAEMAEFLAAATEAARVLEGLPANLPAPKLDFCVDLAVANRFGTVRPQWPHDLERQPLAGVRYPLDLQYISGEKSCGVDPDWRPGTLYRLARSGDETHAGNVLGFWAAHPDDLLDDVRLQIRPTNLLGVSYLKEALELAGGAAVGTVWVPLKCLARCGGALIRLDFEACETCIRQAVADGAGVVHDGIAGVDGIIPGIGEFKSDLIVGMCHHIDLKDRVTAPGWAPVARPRYDDLGGLYSIAAGPIATPGLKEMVAIAVSDSLGVTVNAGVSDSTRNYEVPDGRDLHPGSKRRTRQEWEYLTWPHVPFTPLDNLAWYGWDRFKASAAEARRDPGQVLQTRYLGWLLHGLGDATVPMHVTGTFAWGHRPYEDAVEEVGRALLGGDQASAEVERAIQVLRQAYEYHRFIRQWRRDHPELGHELPVRDLVTLLATRVHARAMASPMVFNDALSTAWVDPLLRGATITAYGFHSPLMREFLGEAVAATIAALVSAVEVAP